MSSKYQILRKDGKEQFVVMPYEGFLAIQERLDDAEDSPELRKAIEAEGDAATMSLDEAKRLFAADDRDEK